MENIISIKTELGIIQFRDTIFLDKVDFDYSKKQVELKGEIVGSHCTKKENVYVEYSLIFKGIYYFNMIELDVSYKYVDSEIRNSSCFVEVFNSELLKNIKKLRNKDLRHFVVHTYDDVFVIACVDFELILGKKRPR